MYSCSMKLIACNSYITERIDNFKTRSLYSEICYQVWGKIGLYLFETCLVLTLFGVGIVYTVYFNNV